MDSPGRPGMLAMPSGPAPVARFCHRTGFGKALGQVVAAALVAPDQGCFMDPSTASTPLGSMRSLRNALLQSVPLPGCLQLVGRDF